MPLEAQLFTGEIPVAFEEMPTFDGQVTITDGTLLIETPWGQSSGETDHCFAVVYGLGTDQSKPKFFGNLDGNILTVGTPSFEDYYHVTEKGTIIETLHECFDNMN